MVCSCFRVHVKFIISFVGFLVFVGIVFGLVTCHLVISFLRNMQNNKSLLNVLTGSHFDA
jgi:hypothetical protein